MDSEYSVVPLGEVAAVRSGYAFKSSDMGNIGYPLIKIGNIEPPRVEIEGCDRIPETVVRRTPNSERYILKAGDILIAMTGATAGKVGRFPVIDDTCYLNQRVGKVYPSDLEAVSHEYLYQVLARESFSQEILSLADGSAQGNVSGKLIETYEIPLPPLGIQRSIAHILGTLDDKIELNRKTNETLEGIAKALFKSWFVDFDPVRAKAEGRPTGLPDEISELFPDSFEQSELGEIPSGWSVAEIGDLLDLERDSVTPSDSGEEIFDHYSIPAFDEGLMPSLEAGQSIKSNKYLVKDGVFMVSKLNPRFPRIWVPSKYTSRRRICSTEFLVCRPKVKIDTPFALHVAKSRSVVQQMSDLASGTSNSHQRVRSADFVGLPFVKPSSALVKLFSEMVGPMLEKHLLTRDENEALSKSRDTLLPRLISGELRVPDAEKMLEEVGI